MSPKPTEVMIETLEKFGLAEPSEVLIIYIAEDGTLYYRSTADSTCVKLGMLALAKEVIVRRCFGEVE